MQSTAVQIKTHSKPDIKQKTSSTDSEKGANAELVDPFMQIIMSLLTQTYGFLPGYHMNKKYWITMLLDGSVSEAKILDFLEELQFWDTFKEVEVQHHSIEF